MAAPRSFRFSNPCNRRDHSRSWSSRRSPPVAGEYASGIATCIEDGLEWAEVDLRLTQDGQHVLSHDASVTDADGKVWKISEHSLAELRQVDVGSRFAKRFAGERLLSLKECFALCKGG